MDEIDFTEIQRLLDRLLGGELEFQELAARGAEGGRLFSWSTLAGMAQDVFLKELLEQKQLWVHILILAVSAAVLVHFADVLQSRSVSRISSWLIYLLLFLLLLSSFRSSLEIAAGVLENMGDFMAVLAPAYLLAMTLSARFTSAGVYYEFILLLISAVRWAAEAFVLPCIQAYVLLSLVNGISGESRLGKLTELTELLVGWTLKASLAAVTGFHMIQGLVSPAADSFRTTALSRGLEMVPGVGDVSGSVTELVLGSAVLIKNGIGAAALVALICLCLVPLTKLAVIMAVYYLMAAVLQPISEERLVGCLTGMGRGVGMLLRVVFTVLALFMLTVALSASG